jgi:hypothetical protein
MNIPAERRGERRNYQAEPSAGDGNTIQLVLKKNAYIANLFPVAM